MTPQESERSRASRRRHETRRSPGTRNSVRERRGAGVCIHDKRTNGRGWGASAVGLHSVSAGVSQSDVANREGASRRVRNDDAIVTPSESEGLRSAGRRAAGNRGGKSNG